MAQLKTKAVQARINYYVKSDDARARHEKLRNLLPQLRQAILQYFAAKNKKSNGSAAKERWTKK
jgi:hypothetical protein